MRICCVSYEGSLFGIDVDCNPDSEEIINSHLAFGFHETPGSLKALAISSEGKYLICGGMDEYIRAFNLEKRVSFGEMSGHTGCVTALKFVGEKFVISGSEDGTLIIWKAQGWQRLHILGGHKGPVNDFALHPSGKLCVSVSKDNTLKIWNLVHGRCAFTRRLKGPAQKVAWHKEKDYYLLATKNEVQIYDSGGNNECTGKITSSSRVNQACFVDIGAAHDVLGAEQGEIYVAIIYEDNSLRFVNERGSQIGEQHDLGVSLGGGRPRDMSCCSAGDLSELGDEQLREYMDGEGDAVTIVSSSGSIAVLSARRLCQGGDDDDEEGDGDGDEDEDAVAHARFATFSIPSEPRITALVSYSPKTSGSGTEKGQHDELELLTEGAATEVSGSGEEEDSEEEKKGKKRKAKAEKVTSSGEGDRSRETKRKQKSKR
jgi:protein MAK11